MENIQNSERILDKIKKCFALSKSNNPNEAAIALRQAKALMEKYAIDTTDVMIADVKETEVKAASRKKLYRYESWLAYTVSEAFNCRSIVQSYITSTGYQQNFLFIGIKPTNEIAAYVFEVTHRRLKKDRLDYIKNELEFCLSKAEKTHRANYFCEAWVKRIYQTVEEFAKNSSKEKDIVNKFRDKKYGELNKTELKSNNEQYFTNKDYQAGHDKASDVKLYDAVNKEDHTLIEN